MIHAHRNSGGGVAAKERAKIANFFIYATSDFQYEITKIV